jgi:hypothetical protein
MRIAEIATLGQPAHGLYQPRSAPPGHKTRPTGRLVRPLSLTCAFTFTGHSCSGRRPEGRPDHAAAESISRIIVRNAGCSGVVATTMPIKQTSLSSSSRWLTGVGPRLAADIGRPGAHCGTYARGGQVEGAAGAGEVQLPAAVAGAGERELHGTVVSCR